MSNSSIAFESLALVYDGECPFCKRYVALTRLRDSAGDLLIINARDPHPLVDALIADGYDLDDGMVVKAGDTIYHGDQAIHALALMSSRIGWFNRLNFLVFRSAGLSRLLYPVLRAGRNGVLRILGRKKIHR